MNIINYQTFVNERNQKYTTICMESGSRDMEIRNSPLNNSTNHIIAFSSCITNRTEL